MNNNLGLVNQDQSSNKRNLRKTRVGVVVSDKMQKTIVKI